MGIAGYQETHKSLLRVLFSSIASSSSFSGSHATSYFSQQVKRIQDIGLGFRDAAAKAVELGERINSCPPLYHRPYVQRIYEIVFTL